MTATNKRSLLFNAASIAVLAVTTVCAQHVAEMPVGNGYLGCGLAYVSPSVDGLDLDSTLGLEATVGLNLHPAIDLTIDLLYIPKLENDQQATYGGSSYYYYAEMPPTEASALAALICFKYSILQIAEKAGGLTPYVKAGFGFMRFDVNEYAELPDEVANRRWDYSYEGMDTLSDCCFKLGAGVAYPWRSNLSFTGDLSYLQGIGDLDGYDHFAVSLGLAYQFK